MSNIDNALISKNKKADIVFMFLRDNYHFAYLSGLNRLLIIIFALTDILLTKQTELYLFISYVVIAIASILVDIKKPGLYLNRIWLIFDLVFVLYFMQITGKMEHPMAYLIVTTLSTGGLLYGVGLGIVLGIISYIGHVYFSGGVSYSLFHGITFFIIGVVSGYIGELFNYLRTEWIKDMRTMSKNFESLSEKYKVMLGIYSVSEAMGKINVSTKDILSTLLITLKQIPGAENGILRIVNGNKLISIAHYGMFSHKLAQLELEINQGFSGLVANTEKPLLISNISNNNEIINNLIRDFGKDLDEEAKRELSEMKSLVSLPLSVDNNLIGTILIYNTKRHGVFGEDHLKILSIMASQFALHTYNVRLLEKEKTSSFKILELAIKIMSLRDQYMYTHSEEVAKVCGVICDEMGLDSQIKAEIYSAALLHDIGQIGVSDSIIFKKGNLDANEYEQVRCHAKWGSELIKTHESLAPLALMVHQHHERYDGKGYPDGLKGEDITIGARIIALADSFHAMTTDRPYRKAFSLKETIQQIVNLSGIKFDPLVVKAFLEAIKKGNFNAHKAW